MLRNSASHYLLACLICLFITTETQAVEISGSYKNLLFQAKNSNQQNVVTDLNRLRLTLDAQHHDWQWSLSYDHQLLHGGVVRDPSFALKQQLTTPTWLDLTGNIATSSAVDWQHTLYRGWLAYHGNDWQVTVGRQRIAWGSGRIWNPSDRFNPVQVTALEPDQKLGVDALNIHYHYSDFGSLQWLLAPGSFQHGVQRKWALRWQDTIQQSDIALWFGEIGKERVLALDITGNIGDATARLEWQQSWHGTQGDFGQFTVGIDGAWVNSLFSDGLYLAAEYFYNGLPQNSAPILLQPNMLQSNSPQLFAMLAGYDFDPLWRMEVTWIVDLTKTSWFIIPSLRWSARENLDIESFIQLPSGSTGSEFSSLNRLVGLNLAYYF